MTLAVGGGDTLQGREDRRLANRRGGGKMRLRKVHLPEKKLARERRL